MKRTRWTVLFFTLLSVFWLTTAKEQTLLSTTPFITPQVNLTIVGNLRAKVYSSETISFVGSLAAYSDLMLGYLPKGQSLEALKGVGFDWLATADDVIMPSSNVQLLASNELRYTTQKGLRLAFITMAKLDIAKVQEARAKADVVIGLVAHEILSDSQNVLAISKAGASLIVGMGASGVGNLEVVNNTPVVYGLGDFANEGSIQDGLALSVKLDKQGVATVLGLPLKLNKGVTSYPAANEQETALKQMATHAKTGFEASATFWNGKAWQIGAAAAYIRDAKADGTVNLPLTQTSQVRDLTLDYGGYTTGKAIEDFKAEPQIDQLIDLRNGRLQVWRPSKTGGWQLIWKSKPSWTVEQFYFDDADQDGRPELMFTLWKNDGADDKGLDRSHPFVYGWRRDSFRPVWAGSALVDPIREFALTDFNQDGRNDLIVLEGSYKDERHAAARYVTIWHWMGWGYSLTYRSAVGKYTALTYAPGQPYAFFKSIN